MTPDECETLTLTGVLALFARWKARRKYEQRNLRQILYALTGNREIIAEDEPKADFLSFVNRQLMTAGKQPILHAKPRTTDSQDRC